MDTIDALHKVAEQSAAGEIKALMARVDELAEALEMAKQEAEAALVVLAQYRADNIKLKGDVLEMAEQVRAHRWIPVTERMPDFGERVIVWDSWTKAAYGARLIYPNVFQGDNPRFGDLDVTHWQPLPEPPEAGE